ncbi:MAG TPA: ATP-binding cassette domain-containing protein [Ilumatobacter sp.]|nr:ATP-binding cassette domain-containing protein [Ilumatobacter sp.]
MATSSPGTSHLAPLAARSDATLTISGLSHRFGDRRVLDQLDCTVQPGRVTGLLGPNGAGKTTLMRVLFGVIVPDAGTITWHGQPVNPDVRRNWGYMPQERGLYTDMRALDHLVWLAQLHAIDRPTARANAERLLGELGLADRANDRIRDLSGGMAQRVQLAAAMVHDPEFLVLDEPFAGLDPTAVKFLSGVITGHVAAGKSLLFSSHQLDLVEDLCESIVMIHHGRVVMSGDLVTLRADSDDRYLEVDAVLADDELDETAGTIGSVTATGTRVQLARGADAGDVLDRVRANHRVRSFAVTQPRLSEMFLAALGDDADTDADPEVDPEVDAAREPA